MSRLGSGLAVVAVCAALWTQPALAQLTWLPPEPLPRLFVQPREPHMGLRAIGMAHGASAFGPGLEWEANFGHMVGFLRFAGDDPRHAVTLGVQAGVFGRFAFETKKRDLISADWVFVTPLFITSGEHWVRVRYRHISSHLGDDYIVRFDATPEGYLRDDVGVLVYRQVLPALGVYAGGSYAWNVDPNDNKRAALEGGVEVNRHRAASPPWYGGVDLFLEQDASWKPRVNVHAGTWLANGDAHGLRLTFELLTGSSPQGEFRRLRTTYVAVGLVVVL